MLPKETEQMRKVLLNQRSLRVLLRDNFTLQEVDDVLAKVSTIKEEMLAVENKRLEEEKEKQEKLDDIAVQIKASGIDVADLVNYLSSDGGDSNKVKSKRAPRPAKYQYTDSDGSDKTWTGQGRTPTAIQNELDAGKKLESFLIQSN